MVHTSLEAEGQRSRSMSYLDGAFGVRLVIGHRPEPASRL